MLQIKGLPASSGITVGPAKILHKDLEFSARKGTSEDQHARFRAAKECAQHQIETLYTQIKTTSPKDAEIFEAHQMLLEDPMFLDAVDSGISSQHLSAEEAVQRAMMELSAMLAEVRDEYISARSADVLDIGRRVLNNLTDQLVENSPGGIWISSELMPSEVAAAQSAGVLALVCNSGTLNSHAAILARSLGIPAVFATQSATKEISDGEIILVDGNNGVVISQSDINEMQEYRKKVISESPEQNLHELKGRVKPQNIKIKANIASISDAKNAAEAGADGIGVVRTEFLFTDRKTMPTEEEQLDAYVAIASSFQGKPVTIRTLDAGSDKPLPFLNMLEEQNPSLGLRGIRIGLMHPEVLKPQLRAILRAQEYGNLQILVPMITNISEVEQVHDIVHQCMEQLKQDGIITKKPLIGIMVETPSAALNAEGMAQVSDFMSIGTNDLVQYTLAVDRTNSTIASLYDELDPAVLELIRLVVKAGRKYHKPVSVCGEMAANPKALASLLRIGIRELSMNPMSIPKIRKTLDIINQD